RRGKSRRRSEQSFLEFRRGRSDRRSEDRQFALAAAAQFSDDALFVPGRADVVGRRRIRPDAKWKQQRVLSGQRDQLVQLAVERKTKTLVRVHAAIDPAPP